MNVRELKRRLLPYSGYMKPAEDGADAGGGQAAADGGDTATEDRGDDFTPSADADDAGGDDAGGQDGAAGDGVAAAGDAGDGGQARQAPAGIPKARFNQVNQQRKDAEAALELANQELARYRAEAAAKAPAAAPPPAATPASAPAASAAQDLESQEEAYEQALIDGDTKKAAQIRRALNDSMLAQAKAEAKAEAVQELTQRQTAQLLSTTAANVSAAFPYLNTEAGAEALDLILAARDRKIAAGMPPHLALLEAANTIAPKFTPEDEGTPSRVSGKDAPAKDLRPAAALARGAADSTAQPPALQVGIGERATAARVNVAQLTEEQFEALTPAEKKRLRGD